MKTVRAMTYATEKIAGWHSLKFRAQMKTQFVEGKI